MTINRSTFVINDNSSPVLGFTAYDDGMQIGSLNQKFAFVKPSGIFFVHAIITDNFGNMNEVVSSPIVSTLNFTGRIQSVILCAGSYRLEVWEPLEEKTSLLADAQAQANVDGTEEAKRAWMEEPVAAVAATFRSLKKTEAINGTKMSTPTAESSLQVAEAAQHPRLVQISSAVTEAAKLAVQVDSAKS